MAMNHLHQQQPHTALQHQYHLHSGVVPLHLICQVISLYSPITDSMEPIDFFQLFVDDDLLKHIVAQTNIYADQHLAANQHRLGRHSRVQQWVPTDITEMKQFLGLTLLMGLVHKPSMASYWWQDGVFQTPIFGTVM